MARLSWLLALLVVVFAFASASFAATNSDLWLHLATGRLLASGSYTFGVDPFAGTTQGVYWANHTWLLDLLAYLLYRTLGGTALVVAKALLIAGLAIVLLGFRRSEGATWVVAGCTLVSLLAASPRFLLQPVVVSLFLLALCLWLLWRGRPLWLVPALIVLWVNVDPWFFLGPLLVILFWIGDRGRLPLWVPLASLVACLVSPHHVHALRLPPELSPAVRTSALGSDPRFAGLFALPWSPQVYLGEVHLAAWAFVLLLALGVLSFLADSTARRDWRLPVWIVFAGLACWQVRLVPFFAVIGGAVAALTLQTQVRAPGPWLLRTAMGLLAVALIGLCWPGWLQGLGRKDRALSWQLIPDASMLRMAAALDASGQTVFNLHPDAGNYLAWAAPGTRSYLDSRLELFVGVAQDYERISQAIQPGLRESASQSANLASLLESQDIRTLVLSDPDIRRLGPVLRQLARTNPPPGQIEVAGGTLIVRLDGSAGAGSLIDADRLAFGSGTPVPSATKSGTDAAALLLRLFEELGTRELFRQRQRVLSRQAAALVGQGTQPFGLLFRLARPGLFQPDLLERSPALPLLAIREARAALRQQPDDAAAWLLLGQAYLNLGRTTTESAQLAGLAPLNMIRYIQTVTAFRSALDLDPNLAAAHETLAVLFAERDYLDLALEHRQAEVRLARSAASIPGEDATARDARLDRLETLVGALEKRVQDAQNRHAVATDQMTDDPLGRARIAMNLGLAGRALEILLRSRVELFGIEGARLQLELLLLTGRPEEVRRQLDEPELRDNRNVLGMHDLRADERLSYRLPAFEWFDLCMAAATGRVERAESALSRLQLTLEREAASGSEMLPAALAVGLAREVGIAPFEPGFLTRLAIHQYTLRVSSMVSALQFLAVERTDLEVVAGMLALEAGDVDQARTRFRAASAAYQKLAEISSYLPGRELARRSSLNLQLPQE